MHIANVGWIPLAYGRQANALFEGVLCTMLGTGRDQGITPYKSENFLLTFYAPSPFPSPRRGEGGNQGNFKCFWLIFESGQ